MHDILKKSCSEARVPNEFLERALTLFKYVHEGRGFYFAEQFSEVKTLEVIRMLETCEADATLIRFIFDDDCSGKVRGSKQTQNNLAMHT
jgi:hypothetical protein